MTVPVAPPRPARRRRRDRRLQGVRAAPAARPRPVTRSACCPRRRRCEFVGAATFEALSGQPVHTGVFADVPAVPHVKLGQEADLVVVAPATADLLARAASGRADDLLTAALLTARCPVLFVPAMHTEMWEHPATRDNVALLRAPRLRRHGAGVGPAHRPRHRSRPAARARRDRRAGPAAAGAARRAAARPRRPAGGRLRGWHPRGAGSRALPRQPVVGPAGLRAGPGRGAARRRGDAGRRAHGGPGRPGRGGRGARRLGARAARGGARRREGRRRGRDGRGGRRLPARRRSPPTRSRRGRRTPNRWR